MPLHERSFWITPALISALLAIFAAVVWRTRLRGAYRHHLAHTRRERLFLASFAFFVAALVVRGITLAIRHDIGPFHNLTMHGRHIHHLVWGILLLLAVGYIWLVQIGTDSVAMPWASRLTSMLYGVAAALTLDEFALWLNLSDVYWQRQGRKSVEAMALFGGLLATGILGGPFFAAVGRELSRPFRSRQTH